MAVDHPIYPAWNEALERLVEAERRYYIAMMQNRGVEEIQLAALELDDARESYRVIADQIR